MTDPERIPPWTELSEERKAEAEAYGAAVFSCSMLELGERIAQAFALWLVFSRGAEGMPIEELKANLRCFPNARWVGMFCFDRDLAIQILHSGALDPDIAPDPYADS